MTPETPITTDQPSPPSPRTPVFRFPVLDGGAVPAPRLGGVPSVTTGQAPVAMHVPSPAPATPATPATPEAPFLFGGAAAATPATGFGGSGFFSFGSAAPAPAAAASAVGLGGSGIFSFGTSTPPSTPFVFGTTTPFSGATASTTSPAPRRSRAGSKATTRPSASTPRAKTSHSAPAAIDDDTLVQMLANEAIAIFNAVAPEKSPTYVARLLLSTLLANAGIVLPAPELCALATQLSVDDRISRADFVEWYVGHMKSAPPPPRSSVHENRSLSIMSHEKTIERLRDALAVDDVALREIHDACGSIEASLIASLTELRFLNEQLQAERTRATAAATTAPRTIKLNVGGRIFETGKDNLLQHPDSFFYAMVTSETWQPRNMDGAYFIDGNYKYFDRVMAYLRTGVLDVDGLSESAMRQLTYTLQVLGMEWVLQPKPSVSSPKRSSRRASSASSRTSTPAPSTKRSNPYSNIQMRRDDFESGSAPTPGVGFSFGTAASAAPNSSFSNARTTAEASTIAVAVEKIRQQEEQRRLAMNVVLDEYLRTAATIEDDVAALRVAQQRRNTVQKLTQAQAAVADDTIRLNVGGILFETSRATLLTLPDSYFSAMLSQGHWTPREDDGAYFIDQDATYFEYALDALRQGSLNTKGLPPTALRQLHHLLNYLQMDSLIEA
ncbi:hypothetical protein SDRG_10102 [Saprolegnia diclina VS20]|uniref:BTB domain-containing protein n=1 Tax=Saprolegnia diclina (strain VS20) TaxID=1156394 RepID=T0QFI4_SAPDV|nr:hypothetical protein SDRG_10102 [Saprolegnia diclina VS20]EQC32355.1 hypothetical protein SDRG_10102 [Saprolegnia diclina VS20]|eukprot:XP_008614296.1 hypothetical protein SDRG_10102 [Saprolegnia diclina VS20]